MLTYLEDTNAFEYWNSDDWDALASSGIQVFADSTARGSAIASPTSGMVTYLNDIDSLSVYNGTAFTTDRTIQVFAGTAARGSAIGTAVEGMYTHINDTDSLEYYNGSAWVAAGGGGAILQVQSVTMTGVYTRTATTFGDVTGLSVTITPSSTASKILVTGSINIGANGFATNAVFFKLLRGATDIALGNTAGSRIRTYSGTGMDAAAMVSSAINFLDSPSTTSATTYKIQLASNVSGQTASVNRWVSDLDSATRPRGVSTITVMEIAG
jgi:hypothetical protein